MTTTTELACFGHKVLIITFNYSHLIQDLIKNAQLSHSYPNCEIAPDISLIIKYNDIITNCHDVIYNYLLS